MDIASLGAELVLHSRWVEQTLSRTKMPEGKNVTSLQRNIEAFHAKIPFQFIKFDSSLQGWSFKIGDEPSPFSLAGMCIFHVLHHAVVFLSNTYAFYIISRRSLKDPLNKAST